MINVLGFSNRIINNVYIRNIYIYDKCLIPYDCEIIESITL